LKVLIESHLTAQAWTWNLHWLVDNREFLGNSGTTLQIKTHLFGCERTWGLL